MVSYETAKRIIRTPFPNKEYRAFKKAAKVTSESSFTEAQIKKIYVLMVDAFLKGELSIDDISSICGRLFDPVVKVKGKWKSDLLSAVINGSELGFYVRTPSLLTLFNGFLKKVLKYRELFAKE